MAKQKQNTEARLTKSDQALFISGIVATVLLDVYFSKVLFGGRIDGLLVEAVLFALVLGMYIWVLRATRLSRSLLTLARAVSYASILSVVLTVAFVAYFVATFRW